MFTGLIEEIGTVRRIERGAKGARLTIAANTVLENTKIGDSIATNGVCLTVVALTDEMKAFLLAHRLELTVDRVVTIANWAHEKKVEATDEAYARFGYQPGQFIVSYFGNMGICQEMETLVSAVEQMADNDKVQFLFIGHGNKKPAIAERFEKKHLKNVQMHDFLTG